MVECDNGRLKVPKTGKFDSRDRTAVIRLIQGTFRVKLKKVNGAHIWLRDESGKRWCVIGGIGDFHGIPKRIMECEREESADGQLVIAKKLVDRVDVYVGSLQSLIDAKHRLSRRKRDGAYLFNVNVKPGSIRIAEVPSVVLARICTLPHTDSDRDRIKRDEEFAKLMGSMSPDEIAEALAELMRTKG